MTSAQAQAPPPQKTQVEIDADDAAAFGAIPPTGDFVVYGKVFCKPQHSDTLAALYTKMTCIARTEEEGVLYYCLMRDPMDRNVFHFFEHYRSKEDFERHTSREETMEIFREVSSACGLGEMGAGELRYASLCACRFSFPMICWWESLLPQDRRAN